MVALVSVETMLLVLLVVLVAGLLRSHAELLRRVGPAEHHDLEGARTSPAVSPPPSWSRSTSEAQPAPLAGMTPEGDSVALSLTGAAGAPAPTLLAFLTSGCTTCAGFWKALGEQSISGLQSVIVTRGSEREQPSRLRALAPEGVPVVMSSTAWEDYRVPGAPYFVLVDGQIRGEGVATSWQGLSSLIADAIGDARDPASAQGAARRASQVDAKLAAAGIMPGDASLYPGRAPER